MAALFWRLGSAVSRGVTTQVILGGAQPHAGLSPICTGSGNLEICTGCGSSGANLHVEDDAGGVGAELEQHL